MVLRPTEFTRDMISSNTIGRSVSKGVKILRKKVSISPGGARGKKDIEADRGEAAMGVVGDVESGDRDTGRTDRGDDVGTDIVCELVDDSS